MVVDAKEDRDRGLRRGTKQTGVRLYNERLVLSLIRQRRALPKAEIARLTGLSSTTIAEIAERLEADGLLMKQEPQRGRIGQPPVPLSLNPDGALSLGVKIGRRRCDILLMDFVGGVRGEMYRPYLSPRPDSVVAFIKEACDALIGGLPRDGRSRMAGIGIAAPPELWNRETDSGAHAIEEWRDFDLRAEVARFSDLPVYLCNDGIAGCAAEYIFGHASAYQEFLYVFVAWFTGGGLVLNGNLFPGRGGHAGSLGQMLVPATDGEGRVTVRQLQHVASISVLERRVREAGGDPRPIWDDADWAGVASYIDGWIEEVAGGIAHALVSAGSLIDFQAAIIDGAMPPHIRPRIVDRVKERFDRLERAGLPEFAIVEGQIGYRARAIGGASLPFLAKFTRDRELLFHVPDDGRASNTLMHAGRPSAVKF